MRVWPIVLAVTLLLAPSQSSAEATWELLAAPGAPVHGVAFDPTNPARVFVGTYGRGMYFTQDDGLTWAANPGSFTTGSGGTVNTFDALFDPANPSRGIAITRNGTYRSTTGGVLWELHPGTAQGDAPLVGWAIEPLPDGSGAAITEGLGSFGGGRLFVYRWDTDRFEVGVASDRLESQTGQSTLGLGFTADGQLMFGHTTTVFYSENLGQNLIRNEVGLPDNYPRAVRPDPEIVGVALIAVDGGLFRQNAVGATWEPFGVGLPAPVRQLVHHPDDADVIYAATNIGVYRSEDRGANWEPLPLEGLQDRPVIVDIAIHPLRPTYLYATSIRNDQTDGAVYRIAIDDATNVETSIGSGFASRARPNPFGNRTAIEFTLDRARSVRIDVFDTAGRRIYTLVDGRLEAGFHAPTWGGRDRDGRALASGVYFYRVVLDGTTADRGRFTLKR